MSYPFHIRTIAHIDTDIQVKGNVKKKCGVIFNWHRSLTLTLTLGGCEEHVNIKISTAFTYHNEYNTCMKKKNEVQQLIEFNDKATLVVYGTKQCILKPIYR